MSRWIDADELGASVIKNTVFDKGDVIKLIEDAPTIDIVRCSECKYASDDGTYGCMCEHFNDTSDAYHRMWSDDFCSRGERNSSEKPNSSTAEDVGKE